VRARVAELEDVNARLRQAARDRDELAAAQLAARGAQVAALAAQVGELRRRLDKDSSTSSRPPSSDSPYKKKPRDRSLRGTSGRKPGRQPGAESPTLRQSPDPDEIVLCGPASATRRPWPPVPTATSMAARPRSSRRVEGMLLGDHHPALIRLHLDHIALLDHRAGGRRRGREPAVHHV